MSIVFDRTSAVTAPAQQLFEQRSLIFLRPPASAVFPRIPFFDPLFRTLHCPSESFPKCQNKTRIPFCSAPRQYSWDSDEPRLGFFPKSFCNCRSLRFELELEMHGNVSFFFSKIIKVLSEANSVVRNFREDEAKVREMQFSSAEFQVRQLKRRKLKRGTENLA